MSCMSYLLADAVRISHTASCVANRSFVFSMLTSSPLLESNGTVATTASLQLWTDNKAFGDSKPPVASGPCTLRPLPDGGANVTCTVQDNSVEPEQYVAVVNSTSSTVGVPVITMTYNNGQGVYSITLVCMSTGLLCLNISCLLGSYSESVTLTGSVKRDWTKWAVTLTGSG